MTDATAPQPASTPQSDTAPQPDSTPQQRYLVAERTGPSRYTGRNERGAEVAIGPEGRPGVFSPGELLAIAVAACAGMSADPRLAFELGDDVPISVLAHRSQAEGENRYDNLTVELVVSAGNQDPSRQQRMLATAATAIEKYCTVSRTLKAGAEVAVVISAE